MSSRLVRILAVIGAVIVIAFVAQRLFGDKTLTGAVRVPEPVATIGEGEEAVAVSGNGAIVSWWPLEAEPELPRLPLSEPPKSGHLAGPMLQQARVLGAAPAALRPYLARSYYGESGVDVETTAGIEVRFGESSMAAKKWKVAAAIIADPTIEALDYVDVHAPAHPSYGGSGHTLPPAP